MEADSLLLRLDGFEGPLDLLLDLARNQKVDLKKISILSLVEQFLSVIEDAKRVRLELAADWLVTAAWLTWLKSRLLRPIVEGEEDPTLAVEILQERLVTLQAMRQAAVWLRERPQLGWDVFSRGYPEDMTEIDSSQLKADLNQLMAAYMAARRRSAGRLQYRPRPMVYFSFTNALERLERLVRVMPDWSSLDQFIPKDIVPGVPRRAAVAATLLAGLRMAKEGKLNLRQDDEFGPILIRNSSVREEEGV